MWGAWGGGGKESEVQDMQVLAQNGHIRMHTYKSKGPDRYLHEYSKSASSTGTVTSSPTSGANQDFTSSSYLVASRSPNCLYLYSCPRPPFLGTGGSITAKASLLTLVLVKWKLYWSAR